MSRNLITPPAREPLSLALAKSHLKVDDDFTADDNAIQGHIIAARGYCEGFQNRSYLEQTWDLWLDGWPSKKYIDIPLPPLQSVASILYYGSDDTEYTLALTNYDVDDKGFVGRVVLKDGKSWPSVSLRPSNGVVVRFVAGYQTYRSTVDTASVIITATIVNPGADYQVNDVLTVVQAGASGGTLTVDSIDGSGAILTVTITTAGEEYFSATNLTTTVSPLGGINATVTITTENVVTKTAGDDFAITWPADKLVTVNGVTYRLTSVTSADVLTLATTAGTQTGVFFLADDVPETVKQAMVLHIKLLYDDYPPQERERIEKARDALLWMERVGAV